MTVSQFWSQSQKCLYPFWSSWEDSLVWPLPAPRGYSHSSAVALITPASTSVFTSLPLTRILLPPENQDLYDHTGPTGSVHDDPLSHSGQMSPKLSTPAQNLVCRKSHRGLVHDTFGGPSLLLGACAQQSHVAAHLMGVLVVFHS